jgi:hypothetical protein
MAEHSFDEVLKQLLQEYVQNQCSYWLFCKAPLPPFSYSFLSSDLHIFEAAVQFRGSYVILQVRLPSSTN